MTASSRSRTRLNRCANRVAIASEVEAMRLRSRVQAGGGEIELACRCRGTLLEGWFQGKEAARMAFL